MPTDQMAPPAETPIARLSVVKGAGVHSSWRFFRPESPQMKREARLAIADPNAPAEKVR